MPSRSHDHLLKSSFMRVVSFDWNQNQEILTLHVSHGSVVCQSHLHFHQSFRVSNLWILDHHVVVSSSSCMRPLI